MKLTGGGSNINEVFRELDKDRQEKIYNAAFEEFAVHGYKKASTNRIVEKAGISKGMLFYYFNSKKELYHDLVQFGIEAIKRNYFNIINKEETDFIEKYRQAGTVKMKAYQAYPHMFNFFGSVYLNREEGGLSAEALQQLEGVRDLALSTFYDNVDTSKFRDDIPLAQIYRMFDWFISGYENELSNKLRDIEWMELDFEPYWEEYYQVLDDLKTLLYKEV